MNVRRAQLHDSATIARIQVDTWRSAYRGIVPDSYLDSLSYERAKENWEKRISDPDKRNAAFVVEDEIGGVIGFATCGVAREDARDYESELYAIYVNQSMQRKGLGKRLVLSVARHLRVQGFNSMLIWVLADNQYKQFYESIGGTRVGMKQVTIGGATLLELGYGWRDIDALIALLALD